MAEPGGRGSGLPGLGRCGAQGGWCRTLTGLGPSWLLLPHVDKGKNVLTFVAVGEDYVIMDYENIDLGLVVVELLGG